MPVPAAPTSLTVTARSPSQVILRWTDNATDETGYIIERKLGAGAFARISAWTGQTPTTEDITLQAGATYYMDGRIVASTTYTWRVRAINASGESTASNEVTLTTDAFVPAAVRDRTIPIMYSNDIPTRADLITRSGATVAGSAAYIVCDIGIGQGVTTEVDIQSKVVDMRAKGIEPLGYIPTNRGTEAAAGGFARTVAATKTYVDQWAALGVWSIFLDEGGRYHPNTDATPDFDNDSVSPTPSYYEQMYQYIVERTPGGAIPLPRVFLNAAQWLPDDWSVGCADVVNVFEDTGTVWNNDGSGAGTYNGSSGSSWSTAYPKNRLTAIIHTGGTDANDVAFVSAAVPRMRTRGIGSLFSSWRTGGDAYFFALPVAPYWPMVEMLVANGATISGPVITAAIAFTTEPAATPTWTDVSSYLQEFTVHRGRQYETDQFGAGMATLVLDNRDRRFDPSYTGGPYGSNVKVGRRLRLQATYDGVTYALFHGYVEAYDLAIAPTNGDAMVRVGAADAFKVLARGVVSATYAEQKTETRIGAVLDAVSWPAADRTLATGLARSQAITLTSESALSHLQQIVADERGALFISRDGKVTFQDRYVRLRPDTASVFTLGDGGGTERLYVNVAFATDDTRIVNDSRVTRTDGTEQSATDSTSQTNYYRRAFATAGLQATDGYAMAVAGFMTQRYKQPGLRTRTLALDPESNPTVVWPLVLARELGDRLTVKRRPPGGGTIDQLSSLEGIDLAWNAKGGVWTRLAWEVSPGTTDTYMVLDHATHGRLTAAGTATLAP